MAFYEKLMIAVIFLLRACRIHKKYVSGLHTQWYILWQCREYRKNMEYIVIFCDKSSFPLLSLLENAFYIAFAFTLCVSCL